MKTVKASWYKQLIEEEALDEERGTLAGKPLAVLSVHGRACPSASHVHLLWERGEGILRLSLFFLDMQDDPRYQQAQKQSQKRLQIRSDLLALCLCPTASYDTKRHDRKQMRMDTYQLSLSLDVYKVLEQVQKTRESYQRDVALWQWWVQGASPGSEDGKPSLELAEAVTLAREVIKELGSLGVRVFHPDLIDQQRISRYGYASTSRSHTLYRSEIERHLSQVSTRPAIPSGGDNAVLLYWERSLVDNPFDDDEEEVLANLVTDATMRRLGRTHGYALRLVLTEPAMQEAEQHARNLARSYATAWSLFQDAPTGEDTENPQRPLPAPAAIWEQLEQEKRAFEEYRERWKASILTVAEVEQLFIG